MFEHLDLTPTLPRNDYEKQLKILQVELHELAFQVYVQKCPVVIVFEGMDAAGKGGAIKRLTEKMDPRGYVVWPISAPSGDDKERHYLYRFWRRLPEQGQIAIFDRSWYGRVLVERLEGFCSEDAWERAYAEINHFERQLTDFGAVIFKFWLHISNDEQLERFRERERTNYKSWKITDEDWRNRAKWEDYMLAAEEMLLKTSTPTAPWTLVEANDKLFARIKVLRTVAEKLRHALKQAD
jgi:polyphosphate kinase 2 (PPK2 family)